MGVQNFGTVCDVTGGGRVSDITPSIRERPQRRKCLWMKIIQNSSEVIHSQDEFLTDMFKPNCLLYTFPDFLLQRPSVTFSSLNVYFIVSQLWLPKRYIGPSWRGGLRFVISVSIFFGGGGGATDNCESLWQAVGLSSKHIPWHTYLFYSLLTCWQYR